MVLPGGALPLADGMGFPRQSVLRFTPGPPPPPPERPAGDRLRLRALPPPPTRF